MSVSVIYVLRFRKLGYFIQIHLNLLISDGIFNIFKRVSVLILNFN